MMGKMMGKNRDDGHVLPVDIVFNLTESLGTLSVAAHSGVKVLPLPESANSVKKMKHVPAQRQSRRAQRITVTTHATASGVAATSKESTHFGKMQMQARPCPC